MTEGFYNPIGATGGVLAPKGIRIILLYEEHQKGHERAMWVTRCGAHAPHGGAAKAFIVPWEALSSFGSVLGHLPPRADLLRSVAHGHLPAAPAAPGCALPHPQSYTFGCSQAYPAAARSHPQPTLLAPVHTNARPPPAQHAPESMTTSAPTLNRKSGSARMRSRKYGRVRHRKPVNTRP